MRMPNIILQSNPFEPQHIQRLSSKDTIAAILAEHGQNKGLCDKAGKHLVPFIVLADGVAVLQKHWPTIQLSNHQLIAIVVLPQGGGGVLGSVLTLAVAIAAPVLAPTVAGALGVSAGVAGSLIGVGGAILVGTLFSPGQPRLPEFGDTPAASSTYNLTARGNRARLGQPVPIIYGKHKIYPDLAAASWTMYENNEQFLHQLLMIGQGDYTVTDIAIDDTPIANFAEVTTQIINNGDDITLFDPDYVTAPEVSGQELLHNELVGGFVVNPADTRTTEIQVDVVAPRGLYYQNDNGTLAMRSTSWLVEYQEIDDDGIALGEWSTLATETLSAATNTPQRRSYVYAVPSGRYAVRMQRTNAVSTSIREVTTIHWESARAKLSRTTNTSGVTMLAVKMRASNNLSSRTRLLVSCYASRKLPIWHPTNGWSAPSETRALAWAIADIARSSGEMSDQRIDIQALYELDQIWSRRQDYFDAVFDSAITVWEALNRAARAGRAGCFLQGGVLRVVRDQAQSLPVAMFTPRNIVKDSLKIDYRMSDDDTATAVKVKFHNRRSWLNDETLVSLDSDTSDPATTTLFGVTDEAQAIREGLYLARANRYRRKAIHFTTELEGMIPTYGDLITVVHQQPHWGIGGEVIAYDDITRTLTLSEPLDWGAITQGHLMLRSSEGGIQGVWLVKKGVANYQVILPDDANPIISIAGNREKTHYGFAFTAKEIGLQARVTKVNPRNNNRIDITALAEDDRVHIE